MTSTDVKASPTAAEHRREHALAARVALDRLLYGERKRPDPRPACGATMAHLRGCGLWSELSRDVLVAIVEDWETGR